nr:relaxase [Rhizobiaceae bacterium]
MILHGNSRGGGGQLARHLTNVIDNEQVIIHELRGFTAADLNGAFKEAQAIALGTKCKKFLYSLSLNPPRDEIVNTEIFENAINEAERALGLEGQSRAVVFHIKDARLHAHVVWHKIDVQDMKAIDISYDKLKLRSLSKSLYLTHGW